MRSKLRHAAAKAAALKAGRRILAEAAAEKSRKKQPEPRQKCPCAKAAVTALAAAGAVAGTALGAAVLHAALTKKKTSGYVPIPDERAMDYAQKLSAMVKCDTTSHANVQETEKFLAFHRELEKLFPMVHEKLEKTVIDGNLLFRWQGRTSDDPIVLMSHQDVVPAEGEWLHPPFSGAIVDGKVWGRGAFDTKASLMAFFQAVEELLEAGYTPECDVYLASSCTEEWAGDGAPKLVAELRRLGVRPFLVIDEGGGVITDPIGGVKGNFAMVGVFEKGKADVRFTARSSGGHASAPGRDTPIARLAAFVNEVETRPPFRRKFLPEVKAMFRRLSPYAPFHLRLVMGNLWLFGPVMKKVMPSISAQAAAMLQTTIAFTMQSGSDACNVLPQEASVSANMRFIPHQGEEESLELMRELAAKYGLEMEIIHSSDYTTPVDIKGKAFRQVERVIGDTFPGLPVCPYVMTGATDASFYQAICGNCIRFAPIVAGPEQMAGMHGLNENMGVDCLPKAVDFYKNLICAQEER